MSDVLPRVSIRARTREILREQIVDRAVTLFREQGYDAVTVEQIASTVGMSRRTLHRYFASKDDIVLEHFDLLAEVFAERLRSRPSEEDTWESLRHTFVASSDGADDEASRRNSDIAQIVSASSGLIAGSLERTQRAQGLLADVLRERAEQRGQRIDRNDPTFDAVVAAACACRNVAVTVSASTGVSLADALTVTMGAVRPSA